MPIDLWQGCKVRIEALMAERDGLKAQVDDFWDQNGIVCAAFAVPLAPTAPRARARLIGAPSSAGTSSYCQTWATPAAATNWR